MTFAEINKRYSELAQESCCLSCGKAIDYSIPQPGEVCLDLGSGRGNDVLKISEYVGVEGFVYGIDISDGMLEKARITADKLGVKNVKFIKSELEKIPIEDGSVDLVISNCTINHSLNKQQVWKEIFRVLKPTGRFIISDIYSTQPVPERYSSDSQAVAECWGGAVTQNEYFAQVKDAGFKQIEILEESTPYSKGEIEVVSFTLKGTKKKSCC